MSKLDQYLSTYQGNMYPGMLNDLAADLRVDPDAIAKLDLGWAPVVEFKKGTNYQGWWVVPERNQFGEVTGLSLRPHSSICKVKPMLPGSKHGLTYAVNTEHERGTAAYKHGAHNWVRLKDAEIECPICGKPDGCLVSAENPQDPKAVICIRVVTGSKTKTKMGYLHITKPEGDIKPGVSPLPDSEHPVIVVEGMSDVAAAMSMGYVAVGRPSNLAGLDMLQELVRGRDVVIVGDNDEVNPTTGRRPGEEGVIAASQVLRKTCKQVITVFPPPHIKDLRAWYAHEGLDAGAFATYIEEHGTETAEDMVIDDDRDLTVARAYLMDQHRMAGRYTLRCQNGVWFQYVGGKYQYVEELKVGNPIYQWAHDKYVQKERANGETQLVPLKASRHMIGNTVAAMNSETAIEEVTAPQWINHTTGPDPHDLISFANGLLHVPSYLEGRPFDEYMLDHTPDLFTLACLPFAFDPTAKCPEFQRWSRSSLGDEFEKIHLAQEYAGYCMTSDISFQKMLWLRGVPAAGKSLFIDVLNNLVGNDQYANIKIRQLTERFGMTGLIGTLVAAIRDLRMPRNVDGMVALESILNVVGGDPVPIERKYRDIEASHRLMCKFVFSSNEMPKFADPTGALKRRLLLVEFRRGFVGKEDRQLPQKLKAETPGIAVWALQGLKRLREQGHFTEPPSMLEALNEWHRDNSPVSTFIEECIEYDDDAFLLKAEAYDAFRQWATEHGHFPCSFANFKQRWMDRVSSNVKSITKTVQGHKYPVYTGVKLVDWAEKNYLGKPRNQ